MFHYTRYKLNNIRIITLNWDVIFLYLQETFFLECQVHKSTYSTKLVIVQIYLNSHTLFETGSHYEPRLGLNLYFSCLRFPGAGILGVHYHTQHKCILFLFFFSFGEMSLSTWASCRLMSKS
jgi:hypothetical protein